MAGVPFVNKGYTKMVLFLSKMVYKRERGLDLGVEPPPPYKTLLSSTWDKKPPTNYRNSTVLCRRLFLLCFLRFCTALSRTNKLTSANKKYFN